MQHLKLVLPNTIFVLTFKISNNRIEIDVTTRDITNFSMRNSDIGNPAQSGAPRIAQAQHLHGLTIWITLLIFDRQQNSG